MRVAQRLIAGKRGPKSNPSPAGTAEPAPHYPPAVVHWPAQPASCESFSIASRAIEEPNSGDGGVRVIG